MRALTIVAVASALAVGLTTAAFAGDPIPDVDVTLMNKGDLINKLAEDVNVETNAGQIVIGAEGTLSLRDEASIIIKEEGTKLSSGAMKPKILGDPASVVILQQVVTGTVEFAVKDPPDGENLMRLETGAIDGGTMTGQRVSTTIMNTGINSPTQVSTSVVVLPPAAQ